MVTSQPSLFDRPLFTLGACAFGPGDPLWLGPHHCQACADEVDRACAAFHEGVAREEYDSQGFTPNERRAVGRRAA